KHDLDRSRPACLLRLRLRYEKITISESRFGTRTSIMQAVRAISGSAAASARARVADRPPPQKMPVATALVPVSSAPPPLRAGAPRRPLSACRAQRAAPREGAPQTRALRRAEPADAVSTYAAARMPAPAPTVQRSL